MLWVTFAWNTKKTILTWAKRHAPIQPWIKKTPMKNNGVFFVKSGLPYWPLKWFWYTQNTVFVRSKKALVLRFSTNNSYMAAQLRCRHLWDRVWQVTGMLPGEIKAIFLSKWCGPPSCPCTQNLDELPIVIQGFQCELLGNLCPTAKPSSSVFVLVFVYWSLYLLPPSACCLRSQLVT